MDFLPKNSIFEFEPGTLEYVRNYFDLNKSKIEQSLQILEEWIQKQQHFVSKDFDRAYLERVLVIRKGSVERAKSQIDKICTLRTLLPKYFEPLATKEDIKSVMDQCVVFPLPKMTKDHNRIIFFKLDHTNITSDTFVLYCRFGIHITEYITTHDYHSSIVVIKDFTEANLLELMMKLNISDFQQLITILINTLLHIKEVLLYVNTISHYYGDSVDLPQPNIKIDLDSVLQTLVFQKYRRKDGYGMRVSRVHIITDSTLFDLMMKFVMQCVSKKIASRVMLHDNIEDLYEYVDRSLLPVELGGTDVLLDNLKKEWVDVLSEEKNIQYVRKKSKFCTNENFRLDEKFNNLYLGTSGSFRNLRVD